MIAVAGISVGFSGYERALPKIVSLDLLRSGVFYFNGFEGKSQILGFFPSIRLGFLSPLKALKVGCLCYRGNRDFQSGFSRMVYVNQVEEVGEQKSNTEHPFTDWNAVAGTSHPLMSTVGKSTNIVWQECSVGKLERQKLLQQKGCVIWITGFSGSGKSTLACALSRQLHSRGKLSYILDGDNLRHGLNRDLSFEAEHRAENIRRVGEVAQLFADAGVICITSLISPYRSDRDACRSLLPEANFIEVFIDLPLEVCEARDSKGLYKLAREGKIKGFTGVDDPYEPPLNCEIVIEQKDGVCSSPCAMAEQVMSYLEEKGFLQ